jgi:hypothetical protein
MMVDDSSESEYTQRVIFHVAIVSSRSLGRLVERWRIRKKMEMSSSLLFLSRGSSALDKVSFG